MTPRPSGDRGWGLWWSLNTDACQILDQPRSAARRSLLEQRSVEIEGNAQQLQQAVGAHPIAVDPCQDGRVREM